MSGYDAQLQRVTACGPSRSRPCPARWLESEKAWRLRSSRSERRRLVRHAEVIGKMLPSSPVTFTDKRWKPLVSYEPEYSCGKASRRFPERGDIVGGSLPDDGSKWLCGPVVLGGRARQRPCTVLSVGSNFADAFERALSATANCTSYVLDPTLGQPESMPVQQFAQQLAGYGARLNATTGLGAGTIRARDGTGPNQLVSFREVMRGSGQLFCADAACQRWHISLAKIDAEGGEVCKGQSIPLCNLRAAP